MNKNLVILPLREKSDSRMRQRAKKLEAVLPGENHLFTYENNTILDLKKLLINESFNYVALCFPSLESCFDHMQVIRSLAIQSKVLVYAPDLSFIKEAEDIERSNPSNNELTRWYIKGKSIQLNTFRQADLIVAESAEDKDLLQKYLAHEPLITIEDLRAPIDIMPKNKNKKISIVILTFNQYALTKQCLESLEKHTHRAYELIVVDNGSADATREYLQGLQAAHPHIKLIFNENNVGFAKANNQGMKIATGDYILLLNNDVLLTDFWLDRLILCLESDPLIGVVGPCTNHAVGLQVVGADIKNNEAEIQKFSHLVTMENAGNWQEVHRIIGFCMLLKREVIERVGMFDERFGPGGFEDYDFCLRIKQGGYTIVLANDVFIYHIGGLGYTNNNLDYTMLRYKNVNIFIEKWVKKALEILEKTPENN